VIEQEATADDAIWGSSARYAIETLAQRLGLPRRTFERRLAKARDGRSAAATVQDLRLEMAFRLLPECSTVKEVANRVGYDRSHFAKLFQERFGMPPSDRTR
jgi:transcriptional regulator GlxA family with amidase domain